jgi:hypothetical protein
VTLAPDAPLSSRHDLYRNTTTSETGEFAFSDLAPGVYRVHAWEKFNKDFVTLSEFLGRFSGPSISVREGEPATVAVPLIPAVRVDQEVERF